MKRYKFISNCIYSRSLVDLLRMKTSPLYGIMFRLQKTPTSPCKRSLIHFFSLTSFMALGIIHLQSCTLLKQKGSSPQWSLGEEASSVVNKFFRCFMPSILFRKVSWMELENIQRGSTELWVRSDKNRRQKGTWMRSYMGDEKLSY